MSNSRSYQPALIADVVTNPTGGQVALRALAADVLPDGCQCFVDSNRILYRLSKLSTDLTPGGAAGGLIPAQGGGVWIPQNTSGGTMSFQNFTDLAVALNGASNFHPLIGTFAALLQGAEWDFSTTTGVATWRGPSSQRFLLTTSLSMYSTTTVIPTLLGVAIDGSSSIPSGRTQKATSPVATGANAVYQLSMSTIVLLNQGQTVELMLAGNTTDLTVPFMQCTLTPLS